MCHEIHNGSFLISQSYSGYPLTSRTALLSQLWFTATSPWYNYISPPRLTPVLAKESCGSGVCPFQDEAFGACGSATVIFPLLREQQVLNGGWSFSLNSEVGIHVGQDHSLQGAVTWRTHTPLFCCKALKFGDCVITATLVQCDWHPRVVIKWKDMSLHTFESLVYKSMILYSCFNKNTITIATALGI